MSDKPKSTLIPPYDTWDIRPPWLPPEHEHYPYQRMVRQADGKLVPLLSIKGYEVFNCYKRFLLASGSKRTGKTLAIANRFLRNMWEVDGAVGGIVGHTMGNTKGGTWRDLVRWVIPGWAEAKFGMKILKMGSDATSKKEFIIVSNMHGGESEIQLHSLDYELDVEKKFRSLRFSCIWLAEADLFTNRDVFDLLRQQLRMIGLADERLQFLFDCNPPLEGDMHWLHDVFRKANDPKSKHYQENNRELFEEHQFGLDDNPFISDWSKDEIKRSYAHDPVKYARFVNGDWIVDTAGGLFDETFVFNIHVVGNCQSADKREWEVITPPADAPALMAGIDLGKLNHACSFLVPRVGENDEICYDVFDEVCSLNKKVSVADFAAEVWKRAQFWSEWMVNTYDLKNPPNWRWWADSAVFELGQSTSINQNDAQTFFEVSQANIVLRSPMGQKHRRQVEARVGMVQRLFHANRLFISAHCEHNLGWARFLKPGRAKNETILHGSKHRHTFDATSYALGAELPYELQRQHTTPISLGMVSLG